MVSYHGRLAANMKISFCVIGDRLEVWRPLKWYLFFAFLEPSASRRLGHHNAPNEASRHPSIESWLTLAAYTVRPSVRRSICRAIISTGPETIDRRGGGTETGSFGGGLGF